MKTGPFHSFRTAAGARRRRWSVMLLALGSAGIVRIDAADPVIEQYRLEVVSFSGDYPKDPLASNRQFGPGIAQLNQVGQVLFTAHWRGTNGRNNSSLNLGRPGQVTTVVTGGDPVPEYPDLRFVGGVDNSGGNFVEYTFNSEGEVMFTGGVRHRDLVPSPPPIPFSLGLFKGSAADFELLAASDGTAGLANPPYTGPGALVFRPPDGSTTDGFDGVWLGDNGKGCFLASIDALERDALGNQIRIPVAPGGIIEARFFRKLISYRNGPAPGLGGDFVFNSAPSPSPFGIGRENAAFLSITTVLPRDSTNLNDLRKVLYEYRDDLLAPVYTEGDPLPNLPPLSEILGTTEPYDLRVGLLAVDERGFGVLSVAASARLVIDTRALGYWKTTSNGLAKVFRFNLDSPTPLGPVRFLPATTTPRVAMGGGKAAFVTAFTGLGYTAPTQGVFRETDSGFELVAAAGMNVFGTVFTLSNDFGTAPIWRNHTNEVAFFAGFLEPSTNRFVRALWVDGRDRYLRRVCYVGQQLDVAGTNRTVALVGQPSSISDSGLLAFLVTFRDGTTAILRAVPPGYLDPRPVGRDFFFTGMLGNGNWHATGTNPPTNWEDSEQVPRLQPPGDVDPGRDNATIDGHDVLLNQKPTSVGTLNARGQLTLHQALALNSDSTLDTLVLEAPNGGLTANAIVTVSNLNWRGGRIDGSGSVRAGMVALTNGGVSRLEVPLTATERVEFEGNQTLELGHRFVSERDFLVRSGVITNLSASAAITNLGSFVKTGPAEVRVFAPYHNRSPNVEIQGGSVALLGGGSHRFSTFYLDTDTVLTLAGTNTVEGTVDFTGPGTLELGTSTDDVRLELFSGSSLGFSVERFSTHFNRGELIGEFGNCLNQDRFVWNGGRIALGDALDSGAPDEPGFVNNGSFFISDSATQPRRLDGLFINNGAFFSGVGQQGSFELGGSILNRGGWIVARPVTISGSSGTFRNDGTSSYLVVDLEEPGTVVIESEFWNHQEIGPVSSVLGSPRRAGIVMVGLSAKSNQQTILQLRGAVGNLAGTRLVGGSWEVYQNCTLEFPSPIETIALAEVVLSSSGDIPALHLRENNGRLELRSKNYATPGDLVNQTSGGSFPAELIVWGTSTLTVNGSLTNSARLACRSPAKIVVTGDLVHQEPGFLEADGEIIASGIIQLDGPGRFSGVLSPGAGTGTLALSSEAFVGSSPGRLTVNGSVNFASTATLTMEVAGTQTNQFDIVAVSGPAILGGRLALSVIDGFRPAPGDSFPMIQAGSLTGQFSNAPHGQRLATVDGYGSFLVSYTPTSVVLSAFQTNPNPPPTSPGQLFSPTFGFNGVELTLTGSPGRDYILQTSTNLLNWLSLRTNNASFDGQLRFELPATTDPHRFFRALGK